MIAIVKSVIMSVENEWIVEQWGSSTPYVLGMQHTTHVLLIWGV